MQNSIVVSTSTVPAMVRSWDLALRLPAAAVLLFGAILLYGVGFSTLPVVHNSVHDARHAAGFPCH